MTQIVDRQMAKNKADMTQPWHQSMLALILLLAWILVLYRDTGIAMATIWYRSETFTHGFLVPPIVFWLIWRQRQIILTMKPKPAASIIVFVAGSSFLWLLGDLVAVNAVTQLAFVALLVLAVPAVLGIAVTRLIIFPLGFLFFCVPIGEFLLPQLMEWTANFTVLALRFSGIPVYREGLQFVIPSGNWSVVEACSGVRYLIASLTVGTLFAYLNYQSTKKRFLFVLVSIVVPVFANWLRAYMIVMLGHLSGNKLAVGVDHLIYGWVFFGIVIMLMFIVGARWAEPEVPTDLGAVTSSGSPQPGHLVRLGVITGSFAILTALPMLTLWWADHKGTDGLMQLVAPTTLSGDWQSTPSVDPSFKPAFENPSAEINTNYLSQGRQVGLYLGYYRHQSYARKLVSSNNVLVPSSDLQWAQVAGGGRAVTLGDKSVEVRTAELRGSAPAGQPGEGRLIVWQLYWINGTLTASDYAAKVYSALYRLTGRGDESAVIIVSTPKNQSGGTEAVLDSFLSTNYPAIHQMLLMASQSR